MTEQGMDRLGDITQIQSLYELNDHILQGQEFLRVRWEGYNWTEADELYHTVWETVEGEESILSPVTGNVVSIANSDYSIIDEDIPWAELECDEHDLLREAASWVDETAYQEWANTLAPSRFDDRVA
jgi:hypothetical protein